MRSTTHPYAEQNPERWAMAEALAVESAYAPEEAYAVLRETKDDVGQARRLLYAAAQVNVDVRAMVRLQRLFEHSGMTAEKLFAQLSGLPPLDDQEVFMMLRAMAERRQLERRPWWRRLLG